MAKRYYMRSKSGKVFTTHHPEYHQESEQMKQTEGKKAMRDQAILKLSEYFTEGATIYTVLRKVSASGMSRQIDVFAMKDNIPVYLTSYAADALGWKQKDGQSGPLVVSGCGMDIGFHVVCCLAQVIGVDYNNIRHEWI